jgi:O-antigen ligase
MARNRPLLGVGPDNFRWVYGDFAGLTTWDTGGHANSLYFEWLADTGLPGLSLYLWLAWRLVRASVSGLFDRHADSVRVWRLALAASLLTWFLHGVLDYFYEALPTNLAFWLVAGLVLASAESCWRNDRNVAQCALPTM